MSLIVRKITCYIYVSYISLNIGKCCLVSVAISMQQHSRTKEKYFHNLFIRAFGQQILDRRENNVLLIQYTATTILGHFATYTIFAWLTRTLKPYPHVCWANFVWGRTLAQITSLFLTLQSKTRKLQQVCWHLRADSYNQLISECVCIACDSLLTSLLQDFNWLVARWLSKLVIHIRAASCFNKL